MKVWTIATIVMAAVATAQAATCNPGCPEIFKPVCGSDGKTYDNQCTFDYTKCSTKNESLKVVSQGECPSSECDKKACTAIYQPVCGSDGKTYPSPCDLDIAKCKNKDLKMVSEGECGSSSGDDDCDKMCTADFAPVCGSDGKTYSNECNFKNAQCKNESLELESTGECGSSSGSGRDTICKEKACTKEIKFVCGSDGETYNNECLFENAKCKTPSLTKQSDGECVKATPVPSPKSVAVPVAMQAAATVAVAVATAYFM